MDGSLVRVDGCEFIGRWAELRNKFLSSLMGRNLSIFLSQKIWLLGTAGVENGWGRGLPCTAEGLLSEVGPPAYLGSYAKIQICVVQSAFLWALGTAFSKSPCGLMCQSPRTALRTVDLAVNPSFVAPLFLLLTFSELHLLYPLNEIVLFSTLFPPLSSPLSFLTLPCLL